MKYDNLQKYIEHLLSKGELLFSKKEALAVLNISDAALRNSIKRQVGSKRLIRLMKRNYLIVPLEFQELGFVPPELFIDDLMRRCNMDYYICLLSAAGFFGATHQASQNFQIMVEIPLKRIKLGRINIIFYVNKDMHKIPRQEIKTDRGKIFVSSPEATCFDLLKYINQSGNLNHIVTVLSELSENLNTNKIKQLLDSVPLLSIQRLGYIWEILDYPDLFDPLEWHLKNKKKPLFYSPLSSGSDKHNHIKNKKWHLIINEDIESDL